ncbi:RNA polymerase sigma factor, SigZ family [Aliivibrio fischeri MJ11]|uniref:RNA polymerase sigma factor SigZ n=1 Tax=Aliivibrio fischeri (strain MJ11) TaxID=388396 RepID=B5EUX7_ALIFM|nr:RNA polymerase sigma factor SigZ [Aliivibrio fischeri]ACH64457.1 RNA polymerase sigma factor, SigZ family [Aliivibrio fischeri MJ11]
MKLEVIWSEYQSSLKAFLRSKVSNPEDVEDLLQEILIKTHKNLKTISDAKKVKSWIFQIANNTIIDFYRQNNRRTELLADDLWFDEENEEQVMKELSRCLLPFIKQLSGEDAELLSAIEIEGISQKEYAEKHGLKYSTLKSRVKKSREKLHGLFTDCCDFSIDVQGNLIEYQSKSGECNRC